MLSQTIEKTFSFKHESFGKKYSFQLDFFPFFFSFKFHFCVFYLQIVLALIGTAFGSTLIAEAPLAYSSLVYDSPKSSYEYGSSVQTPTYNNYAFVRSGDYERRFINVPATQQYAIAEQQPAVIAARFYQEPTAVFAKAPSVAEVAKAAIPNALPTNFALNSQFTEIRRSFPFSAPAVALPATKLLPIAQSTPILATRYAAPIATPFAAPIAASFAAPIATPIAAPILRTAEPIAVAATAPAAIVDTVVEQKAIGEGLLERKSQYHTQNELGEATYGHREPFQAHDAVQDAAGNKAGSFSYVSPDGRLLQTNYVADQDGYRVASNALPEAVSCF